MSDSYLIDTHCHLDSSDFDLDREQIVERALRSGVRKLICVGARDGFESNSQTLAVSEQFESVWATVGLHPNDATIAVDCGKLKELARASKVVAIGETGLDFYRDSAPTELQEAWFRAQIQLARELHLPLVIHSRNSARRCLDILVEMGAGSIGGVFHCFSEDAEFAQQLREINFLVSITGIVTFPKADALREALKSIPLSQVMVETDAPYLSPVPNRGKRCESAYVVDTARALAKLYDISFDEIAQITSQNAIQLFKFGAR